MKIAVSPVVSPNAKYTILCYHTGEKDINMYDQQFRDILDKQKANGGYITSRDVQRAFIHIPFWDGWTVYEETEE